MGTVEKNVIRIKPGIRLFLLALPFFIAAFIFSYLPLFGWSFAFFDYKPGIKLTQNAFVGFDHFKELFNNPVAIENIVRVMRNTFAMSFLGILTSPLAPLFAIFLTELSSGKFKRVVQTLTTLPNFVSWVMVYSVAWAMLSVGDGFINRLLINLGLVEDGINFLASQNNVWLTMLSYQVWKGLGWSAIIYLAAIASIDGQLYEAATVDGAGRFRIIWHIVIPGIIPTYFVLLLLSFANFINNGMEQYYIFQNPMNKGYIEVLDLYVYNQGIIGSRISFSTAVGILKSVVSIVLLFTANRLSKAVRGESIV